MVGIKWNNIMLNQHLLTMVWFAGSIAFDLNSMLEHKNFTKRLALVVFLMRFDAFGLDTLVTFREWMKMPGWLEWAILWYIRVSPDNIHIYVGVITPLKISKTSTRRMNLLLTRCNGKVQSSQGRYNYKEGDPSEIDKH